MLPDASVCHVWKSFIRPQANAVNLIHRLGYDELLSSGLRHYLDADDHNQVIYYCKTEYALPRLEKVLQEAQAVKALMPVPRRKSVPQVCRIHLILMQPTGVKQESPTKAMSVT